ncbi:MAG: chromate transporter [Eubacteriales bacterium]|nr:chromate transporter [Eubacteriales bacterium]
MKKKQKTFPKKFAAMITNMLKIGLIGFGGGTALIPVIEDEIVEKNKVVTEEEFNDEVMIASITPGALPVEIASGIGYRTFGSRGMMAAASAMALPGAFLTILFLILFSSAGEMIKTQMSYLAVGISAFIMLMLFQYCTGTVYQAKDKNEQILYILIILGVFILSAEKNIYQIFGVSMTPIFSISIIQILGTAFFVILSTKGQLRNKKRAIPALIIAAFYFLCVGKAHLIPLTARPFLVILMVVMSVIGMVQAIMESKHKKAFEGKALAVSLLSWTLFTLILSLPALLYCDGIPKFIGTGFLSSVMSFGGGDAYLSVAQGLFVDSGMVSYHDFYGNIVSVANALPGSILCKILSGCGYMIGFNKNGSVLEGLYAGLCGFACSVAASGSIVLVIRAVYEKYENLRIFAVVKHFIRPIISGLLLNVSLTLYLSGVLETKSGGLTGSILSAMVALVIVLNYSISQRWNIHLLWKILFSAGITFLGCNVFV